MAIARKHGIAVIEDVSHAQGSLYKGRKAGTFGEVAALSLMTGKSLAAGEAGILVTDERRLYERALSLGHYERFDATIESPDLKPWAGCRWRVQVPDAPDVERDRPGAAEALRRTHGRDPGRDEPFLGPARGTPGIATHRPPKGSGSTMGGWYAARGLYRPEELGGLSVTRFCEALRAEGVAEAAPGANRPLHLHPCSTTWTSTATEAHAHRAQRPGPAPAAREPAGDRAASGRIMSIPWFKHPDDGASTSTSRRTAR